MRATQTPQPIVLIYKEINEGKFSSVRHFELSKGNNTGTPLTERLNFANNRNFAKSLPDYWVKTRDLKKWSKTALTGLFKTGLPSLYYGDHNKRQSLILFEYSNSNELKIYFFKNYYTQDIQQLITNL